MKHVIMFMEKHLFGITVAILMACFSLSANTAHAGVAPGWIKVSPTIAKASVDTGVDVKLLAAMGAIESGFRTHVKGEGTTAKGVFQFTQRTWDVTVASYGHLYGLGRNADIHNPYNNAVMAAEYIKENIRVMESRIGRMPSYYEIYMAHFISPLRAAYVSLADPSEKLALRWPTIAKLNPTFFYDKAGNPLTVQQFRTIVHRKVNKALHIYGKLANIALVKYKNDQIQLSKLTDIIGQFDTCDVPANDIIAVHFVSYEDESEVQSCPLNFDMNTLGILNRKEDEYLD